MSGLFDVVLSKVYAAGVGRRSAAGRNNTVRKLRRLAELTQAQIAEQVGVSRQTIVAVEAGDYAPSVYLALALADCLHTSVEALFGASSPSPHQAVSTVISTGGEQR
jgi:putative transcriptional regulator